MNDDKKIAPSQWYLTALCNDSHVGESNSLVSNAQFIAAHNKT